MFSIQYRSIQEDLTGCSKDRQKWSYKSLTVPISINLISSIDDIGEAKISEGKKAASIE